jgi:DNA polymerase III subunit gamma/tau
MAKKKANPETPPPETAGVPAAPEAEYTVVARRYRPQQFADLIGQEHVAQALINAITSSRVAHAYLFTGARGVGKTSAARILAKALNCEKGTGPTPCDQCDLCKAIAVGEDIDVNEIDGASNRGIEEIRSIRNNVTIRPSRARYKIYIIDEVHMLTVPAFNALLKTLEEPPGHVKFIFATTEIQKIPITILSRCQRFDFGGINTAKIAEQLKGIVAREQMEADDDALRIIARRAAGSMRDGQSLLEQLLSASTGRLTAAMVHQTLGTAADDRVVAVAGAILARDSQTALSLVARSADEGLQLGELLDQLIQYWRGLMLLNCSGGTFDDLDLSDEHLVTAKTHAVALSLDTILAGLDVLTTAKIRLRATVHAQVVVEMTVVRLSRLSDLVPIAQLSQWLQQPGVVAGMAGGSRAIASGSASDPSKKNGTLSDSFSAKVNASSLPAGSNGPPQTVPEIWEVVRQEAGAMHGAELGKAGPPATLGPKTMVLRFAPRYNHAYEYCRDAEKATKIESLIRKITGQEWVIRYEIDSSVAQTTVEVATPAISNKERERRALESPLLKQIVDVLDGRLLKMDEGFGEG